MRTRRVTGRSLAMIQFPDTTSPEFRTEHRKYLQAISIFVICLAFIHVGILAYAGAYGTLMLNAAAAGTITFFTYIFFRTGRIKTAEVLLSLGSAIFIGIYCYNSSDVGSPNSLLILVALQAPLFMPHLNIAWNVVGIVVPVIMFIFLQQPGFHVPEQLLLTPEAETMINAGIIASCTAFIALAGVFGMRRFIAMRKQHQEREAQLIHASKMASLGEMAAGIAHEINNPLTILVGFSWKALRALENGSNLDRTELTESIRVITDTTKRITDIVRGVGSFSRESSEDPLVPIRISSLIKDATLLCKPRLKKHRTTLIVDESPLFDAEILSIPVHLTQVLVNIIQNAADATSDVTPVSKRTIQVTFESPQADSIQIKITDSGDGIPKELEQKIFEPFFTTKDVGLGTGLGLSISKNIMGKLGGSLTLNQESGKTCFIITTPRDLSTLTLKI